MGGESWCTTKDLLSPIPRSQGWACGPSAFLYILKDYLLDYFSTKFYDDVVNCIFLRQ